MGLFLWMMTVTEFLCLKLNVKFPTALKEKSPHLYLLLVQVKTMALICIAPFLTILAVVYNNVYFLLFECVYAYYFFMHVCGPQYLEVYVIFLKRVWLV